MRTREVKSRVERKRSGEGFDEEKSRVDKFHRLPIKVNKKFGFGKNLNIFGEFHPPRHVTRTRNKSLASPFPPSCLPSSPPPAKLCSSCQHS